jgi:NAD(P)-dependent dehydrogenase (short-subunit alcohol dehydrogenase family)
MGAVAFAKSLADSEKNSYVTGTTILVDGGVVRSVL